MPTRFFVTVYPFISIHFTQLDPASNDHFKLRGKNRLLYHISIFHSWHRKGAETVFDSRTAEVSSQIGVPLFGYPQIIPGHETHTVTWGSTPSLKIRITRLGPKVCGSRGSHKNFGLTFGPFVAIRCGMVNNSCQTWNIIIRLRWIWRYSVYQRLNFLRVWSFSFL